jgi:Ca2+-binding RTX toxin-like protein
MKFQASTNKLTPTELIDPISPPVLHGPGGGINVITPIDVMAPKPVGYALEAPSTGGTLYGSAFADDLFGGNGHDTLYGRGGNDRLYGGNGNDWLDGGAGADLLNGGDGFDTVSYASSTSGVIISLADNFNSDGDNIAYHTIERWVGSSHDDVMVGTGTNDIFNGGAGDDWLIGGSYDDILTGGTGHDVLTGDGDVTRKGSDTFVFTKGSGLDRITDFEHGDDHIDVSAYGHGPNAFGEDNELATGWIGSDGKVRAQGLSEGDRFFFETDTNILWECEYHDGELTLKEQIVQVQDSVRYLYADDLIV